MNVRVLLRATDQPFLYVYPVSIEPAVPLASEEALTPWLKPGACAPVNSVTSSGELWFKSVMAARLDRSRRTASAVGESC